MPSPAPGGSEPQAAVEFYRCESCGGRIEYDVKARAFRCASCRAPAEPPVDRAVIAENDLRAYEARERSAAPPTGMQQAVCADCGGEILFSPYDTASRCPMCGSPAVRAQEASSGVPPDGVVPFRIDRYDAQQLFVKWIGKRWFAPGALKRSVQEAAPVGCYVPYWTYDADARADYAGRGGRTHTVHKRNGRVEHHVDWSPVSGQVQALFDDLQVCASRKYSATMAAKTAPYDTVSDLQPFSPAYLSGYQAERYSIGAAECFETARAQIEAELRSKAQSEILSRGFDQAQVDRLNVVYGRLTYKSVLAPMYAAHYRYREKSYFYAINGESGRVVGSYPKSAFKLALLGLAIAAILIFLYLLWQGSIF